MAHRATNPEPPIIDKMIADRAANWFEETQQLARSDAQHVLEALLAEYGVEAAVRALDNQGFQGDAFFYLLKPLYEEAVRRRKLAQPSWSPPPGVEAEAPLTDEEFEALADQLADEAAAIHKRQGEPTLNLPITREEIYQDHP